MKLQLHDPAVSPATPDDCRDEAMHIASSLIMQAHWAGDKCTWFGRRMIYPIGFQPKDRPTVEPIGTSIHDGALGVAWFLLRAHQELELPAALATAAGAVRYTRHVQATIPRQQLASFHTGILGAAWLSHELYAETQDEKWSRQRDEILGELWELRQQPTTLDFNVGVAGSLSVLARMTREGAPPVAQDLQELYTNLILAQARVSDEFASWPVPKPGKHTPDLTGISHGASGYAWGLLSSTRTNPLALEVSRKAFAYENSWFSEDKQNWADVRNEIHPDQPMKPGYGYGWCYGASGIGITRILAAEVFAHERWPKADIKAAYGKTAESLELWHSDPSTDSCLCHGTAGNADALALMQPHVQGAMDRDGYYWAGAALRRSGKHTGVRWPSMVANGEHPSLKTGVAGVGYWMLRLATHNRLETALLPPH